MFDDEEWAALTLHQPIADCVDAIGKARQHRPRVGDNELHVLAGFQTTRKDQCADGARRIKQELEQRRRKWDIFRPNMPRRRWMKENDRASFIERIKDGFEGGIADVDTAVIAHENDATGAEFVERAINLHQRCGYVGNWQRCEKAKLIGMPTAKRGAFIIDDACELTGCR